MDKLFKYTRGIIAFIAVIGAFVFLFTLVKIAVPEQNKDILQVAAGIVLGVLGTVIAYYFGNSKDKSDQDQSAIYPKDPPNP